MNLELSGQAQAALTEDRPILVLGGPGSGKTTLSLVKAKRLIPDLNPGQEILFLSFSRAAVRQVLIRCKDLLTVSERKAISVKTYHAFCMDILKAHGRLLTGKQSRVYYPGRERVDKTSFDGDWEVEQRRLATEEGLYAFDLFATACTELLTISAIRELISDKFPFVIVDEFQDTDDSQWELVKLLSRGSHLIVLADPDQRIFDYDPRVDPRRLDLLRDFLNPPEFDLGVENHRSPDAGILQFADSVLHNRQLPKTAQVQVTSYWPQNFEAQVHASVIWTISALMKVGIVAPSIAVLGRTNAFVESLSTVLSSEHTLKGKTLPPVGHDVIWDAELIASAAQVIASILEWPDNEVIAAVAKTLWTISNYFEVKNSMRPSSSALDAIKRYRTASEEVVGDRLPQLRSARKLLATGRSGIELKGNLTIDWTMARELLAQISDLNEICTKVLFVRLFKGNDEVGNRLAREWSERGSYGNASEIVKRILNMGKVVANEREPRGCVIMTIHKSKGKEFDAVVLVEGSWSKFFDENREAAPFFATRRLLRVGITRARHNVVIVRPMNVRALVD